jgi:potassium-transporting ATPase KdpC subunit
MVDADALTSGKPQALLLRQLRPALMALLLVTAVTGVIYPAAIWGLGGLFFPDQAEGSLVGRNGVIVGSRLIGQPFSRPEYFHPRPSAAGAGYDATQSSGTNLAPNNPKLLAAVSAAAAAYRSENRLAPGAPIPVDAATSSGSGLDADISPENAALQAPRVAKARGVDPSLVLALIAQTTQGRDLGFLGQPRVSVLELNLALDRVAPAPKSSGR